MRRARVRRPRMRPHRLSDLSVNRMVPNILTLLALCAGMTAMRFAMVGNFEAAVFAIIAAGIFDGLDGRMARLLKATSSFGAELDSLSDFVSFGVAPAAVLYLWTMSEWHVLGWVIVLFFAVCCALRLARFNAGTNAEVPSYAAPFFSGAPAPAGAGLVMIPMFLSFEWGDWLFRSPYLNAVKITGIALLMVSKVPTVSLKRIRIPHHMVVPTLLAFGVATAFLTTAPWPTLMVVGVVYLGSIPLTIRSYYRLKRAAEARKTEPAGKSEAIPLPRPPHCRSAKQKRRRPNGGTEGSTLFAGLGEADCGPFLDRRAQIPGVAGEENRDTVMVLGAGRRVLDAEAVELRGVVGVEPAGRLIGGAVEAGGKAIFGGEPRRQHVELQGADDADDPVAASKRLEDARHPLLGQLLQARASNASTSSGPRP